MLRIRFSRTGKAGQPSYRIVVTERTAPVKGRYIAMLGHYLPAQKSKPVVLDKERVAYWISKGAIPTDSVASLFKKEGMENMDKYMEPRDKKHVKKGEQAKEEAPAAKAAEKPAAPETSPEQKLVEEPTEEPTETPAATPKK